MARGGQEGMSNYTHSKGQPMMSVLAVVNPRKTHLFVETHVQV